MKNVKLIYGTDTGNTEHVIDTYIINELDNNNFEYELVEVSDISIDDWDSHDFYILGIPTWYDGELQSDWENYFETFKTVNGKIIHEEERILNKEGVIERIEEIKQLKDC